jgi:hypothetical protein
VAQSTTAGGTTVLSVTATGEELTYQWQLNGQDIEGATGSTYTLPSTQEFHAGDYTVVVSNSGGSVTSSSAALTVGPITPSASRLTSLSTRGVSLTGDSVLIPGFVIQGTGTKRLLIRAVGATLGVAPFNIGGVLADPVMTLSKWNGTSYDVVATNDNWQDNANAADITQTGNDLFAFPLTEDADAALLVDLGPGQYTVVSSGAADGTGVAIVELYDADTTSTSSMTSIATRGFVGTGNEVMIPGFVVSAEGPKTFLIRVVGPTLAGAPYNVTGTMADPQLTVFRRQGGIDTPILNNDDWSDGAGAANTAQVAQDVFAFALPDGSADAALVATLVPGIYTVVASAADGVSTGVVIVEVYVVE